MTNLNKQPSAGNAVDLALRPGGWDEYIGQANIKKNLNVILGAAKKRSEPCDHLMFYGQAGLGKTTLAYLVAKEMGARLRITSGPALDKAGDLAAILSSLEENDLLFIDEAHRINKTIEEVLYPAMENRKLHIIIGKGPGARAISLDLPPFTLVMATTKMSLISAPLRSRFGATFKLDYYDLGDIEEILKRSAHLLGVDIDPEATNALARASRFTPRVANRLLKRARDFAEVGGDRQITVGIAEGALEFLGIDELGLEPADRQLLEAIIAKFNGGPVGVSALAAALNEERGTIEDVYEPYLMSVGLISRTPAGRVAEAAAYEHLKMKKNGSLI